MTQCPFKYGFKNKEKVKNYKPSKVRRIIQLNNRIINFFNGKGEPYTKEKLIWDLEFVIEDCGWLLLLGAIILIVRYFAGV